MVQLPRKMNTTLSETWSDHHQWYFTPTDKLTSVMFNSQHELKLLILVDQTLSIQKLAYKLRAAHSHNTTMEAFLENLSNR